MNNDYDQMMKLVVIGNSSVGKTCLLRRFSQGFYSDTFIPTVGIDFVVKKLKIDNKIIKITIFDTAGQERFKSIITSYFRSADGILMVFDLTDKQSFADIDEFWLRDIKLNCQENIKIIMIGNKMDVEEKREVTEDEAIAYASSQNITYIETSAKTEQNVNEAFQAIAKDIYFKNKVLESEQLKKNAPNIISNLQKKREELKNDSCKC